MKYVLIGVVLIVLAVGLFAGYKFWYLPGTMSAKPPAKSATNTPVTSTPPNTSPTNNSDVQIGSDLQNVDQNMSKLDSSTTQADQGLAPVVDPTN